MTRWGQLYLRRVLGRGIDISCVDEHNFMLGAVAAGISVANSLARERDMLEHRIEARTKQLEQAQLVRILELQRFADFGRLSAHLLHEVANPLTAAALHLEMHDDRQSKALKQVKRNLQQLERYVNATRSQLKAQSQVKLFSVKQETRKSLAILAPIAQRANVRLEIMPFVSEIKLFGDPVKYNQIVSNLVVNAIDAYAGSTLPSSGRRVCINNVLRGSYMKITVTDWGKGITPEQLPKLFDPFYTTKDNSPRGLGIGLSLVKQTVEQDYSGTLMVSSNPRRGTVFTVKLKLPAQLTATG
jgi:signal transduction histidine kinase